MTRDLTKPQRAEPRLRAGGEGRFLGATASVMHGKANRQALDATFASMRADGMRVARIWALGEFDAPAPDYAFQWVSGGGALVAADTAFVHLDRVVESARLHGLRLILVLANRWSDYGGIPAYLRWIGQPPREKNADDAELRTFFSSSHAEAMFREHATRVVTRVSTVSARPYADDDTILAYEIINEVSARSDATDDALVGWVDRQSRFIRSLDDRHAIGGGHFGYRSANERRRWRRIQELAEIDYVDGHLYPELDPRVRTARDLERVIDDLAADAKAIGKPLVIGELGFRLEGRCLAPIDRAERFRIGLERAYERGAAGVLVWFYGEGEPPQRHHLVSDSVDAAATRSVFRAVASRVRSAG